MFSFTEILFPKQSTYVSFFKYQSSTHQLIEITTHRFFSTKMGWAMIKIIHIQMFIFVRMM